MKRLLILLISSVFSIGISFCQMDTLITYSGEKIAGTIHSEDNNSVTIIMRADGIESLTTFQKSSIRKIRYGTDKPVKTLYWKDRKAIFILNLVMPSVGIEYRLGGFTTLVAMYEPGFLINQHNEDPLKVRLINQVSLCPRFYTNIRFREYKERNTYKFSGTYISPYFLVTLQSKFNYGAITVGPVYGIQRNFGDVGHFSIDIGVGISTAKGVHNFTIIEESAIVLLGNFSFGFAL